MVYGFPAWVPLSLKSVCTSGPHQKWHVQMVMVIACSILAGALGAPPGTRVSNRPVCGEISVRQDVKV